MVLLVPLVGALLLAAGGQTAATERSHAESLARAGRTAEAMALFARIVANDPADVEARLWMARLALRLGNTGEAEAGFRAVLRDHPADIDARIGLGMVLIRNGAWNDAVSLLHATEADAGNNADLFNTLARAYRRGGDDRHALEYFQRAKALSPGDPDVAAGYEAVARTYGHWIGFEGFGQGGAPGFGAASGTLAVDVRVAPRLHLQGMGRLQDGSGYTDAIGGAGLFWRAATNTTASFQGRGGSGNVALPNTDFSAEVVHYAGAFEVGANARRLDFAGGNLVAVSPLLAWNPDDRWRIDGRYTYSRSAFSGVDQKTGDHSVVLRDTWQGWRRVAIQGTYAYGIESFEDLTADRLGSLGTTTAAGGLRIDIPSLTRITTTWEHQWRSNDTQVDRVTLSLVRYIP